MNFYTWKSNHWLNFTVLKIQSYLPTTLFLISNVAYISAPKSDIAQMIFVLDDNLGLTKKVNPCILVPPANSRNTCKTTISNWNLTEMQHHINLLPFAHWLIFYFLSKKYLRQVKNLKIIFTSIISILKVDETIVPKCIQIFSCYT